MLNENKKLIEDIQLRAWKLLESLTNYNENDLGYGLTLDHNEKKDVASIATTGFVLSGYIIAVQYGYLQKEEAIIKVRKTLKTLLYNVPHFKGFFVHFINIHTAQNINKSEYSTIDTTLCLNGVISCSQYFKDDEITYLSNQIINRVEWDFFVHKHQGFDRFYMAYNPNVGGDYVENSNPGFIFQWHMLAEQIPMYILAAGSNRLDKKLSKSLYYGFERNKGSYMGHEYYYSPGNTLFIYQYPLCWIDGKNYVDDLGLNWFNNLKKATLGHRAWNLKNMHKYKTFSKYTFGLTASSTKTGYSVFHCVPSINNNYLTDGTVAPNAMIGSLITNPKEAIEAIKYMKKINGLYKEYGFIDAYNFEDDNNKWYSNRYITIDKGLELLMSNAYLSKDVINAFMNHDLIKRGIEVLEWKKI